MRIWGSPVSSFQLSCKFVIESNSNSTFHCYSEPNFTMNFCALLPQHSSVVFHPSYYRRHQLLWRKMFLCSFFHPQHMYVCWKSINILSKIEFLFARMSSASNPRDASFVKSLPLLNFFFVNFEFFPQFVDFFLIISCMFSFSQVCSIIF